MIRPEGTFNLSSRLPDDGARGNRTRPTGHRRRAGGAPTAKPTPTATPGPTTNPTTAPTPGPTVNPAPCTVFPSTNVWNRRIDDLPIHDNSATLVNSIGLDSYLHPDFSSTAWNDGLGYGIPINKVNLSTPRHGVAFRWDDESDGMILADNGSPWYVTGAPHASWDDDQLHDFHQLHGSDFEVVDTSDFR